MEEIIFFDKAKDDVMNFFNKEFEKFPPLLMSHFLNRFNDIMNYTEEGHLIRPKIIFTDNIEAVTKILPKTSTLTVFEDPEATMFNSRLKSLLAITNRDWCLFIDIKENKVSYGLIMSYRSIKDKNIIRLLEENTSLWDRAQRVHCIIATPINFYTLHLQSISGNGLLVNLSLDKSKSNLFSNEISAFVDITFTKLRTTQRKLQDMKNMYRNIFTNVMSDVNGAICVIVDKDYKDNGLFQDGIWLKEPISFSKLFTQSKSYSEEKLQTYASLFVNMLNYDGITIIDNQGRLRAYNVFVQPNQKKVGYIVGGARKRAAYYIISTKKRDILGVYFQSHEGEVFFQNLHNKNERKIAPVKKAVTPETTLVSKPESEEKPQTNTPQETQPQVVEKQI